MLIVAGLVIVVVVFMCVWYFGPVVEEHVRSLGQKGNG